MTEKKFKYWKARFFLLIVITLYTNVYAQTIRSESNANHYILLLDGTGSMVANTEKRLIYKKVLTEALMDKLYKSGFGESIPPLNPGKDFLTLLYLGVGSGDSAFILSQLKNMDFNDYIHPGYVRRQGISSEDLKADIWPEKFYSLSFSSLSEWLALSFLAANHSHFQINRTFLIKIHDDHLSDINIYREEGLLNHWVAREKLEKIEDSIRFLKGNYRLGDEKDPAYPLSRERFGEGINLILIDSYEIISRAQKIWKDNLAQLGANPYSTIEAPEGWNKEKKGSIEITLNNSFFNLFKETPTVDVLIDDGKGANSFQIDLGPILKVPLEFQSSLLGKTMNYKISIKVKSVQPDTLLGDQVIIYQSKQEDVKISFPGFFRFLYLLYLLIALVLIFIIRKFLNIATGIRIEIPGSPRLLVSLKLGQENRYTSPIKPVLGFHAFSIKLPKILHVKLIGKIIAFLVMKKGKIQFYSEQESDSYWGMNIYSQLKEIQMPSNETCFDIWWKSIPIEPIAIAITFVKGKKKGTITIDFSPGLAIESKKVGLKRMNIIAFDMGSESMAAYYKLYGDFQGGNIDLQEYARECLNATSDDVDYFMTLKGDQVIRSHRLRTCISIENCRQPDPLPLSHAHIDFIDEKGNVILDNGINHYELSLFGFFHKKGQGWSRSIIPNPKVLYQEGIGKIIPEIESSVGTKVRYEPGQLIHHLLSQILRNFVMKSAIMRGRKTKDEQGNKIEDHLVLTIPNIYSITHAENIKRFVKENTEFDEVDTIYESDAIAYYIFDKIRENDKFKRFIEKFSNYRKSESFQVLTFDIGHGTTDLGLIEIFYAARAMGDNHKRQFIVKGRTGRSDGGCRLNYILAEYFNSCLEDIHGLDQFKNIKRPDYDFIHALQGVCMPEQIQVLNVLEQMIIKIKMTMTKNYKIALDEKEQEDYINRILESWINTNSTFKRQLDNDISLEARFKMEFKKMFALRELPGYFKIWLYRNFPQFMNTKTRKLIQLREKFEDYVKDNTSKLLTQLGEIVVSREDNQSTWMFKKIIKEKPTFVIIAGQASQFMPLKASIEKELTLLNIPQSNIVFLAGEDAKAACVKGAVTYKELSFKQLNAKEIHGTFGFMNAIRDPFDDFRILEMKALNAGKKVRVEFLVPSTYWLFYSPLAPYTVEKINPPGFFNGTTALIQEFRGNRIFEVEYDMEKLELVINGVSTVRIATYGNVNESIYPKVWPVVLSPDFEPKTKEENNFYD